MSPTPDVWCLGVDLGGTKIAAAPVDTAGRPGQVLTVDTPRLGSPNSIVEAVVELASQVQVPLSAVGIGTAGAVDPDSGRIVSATDTLPGWTGTALTDLVADGLARRGIGIPVCALNDVDAHAVGEIRHGAATGARSALVVAAGTGIGAAVVLDGRVLRGAHHMAGEMGHVPTPGAEHLRCPCGRNGHLEAIASGAGVTQLYLSLLTDKGTDTRQGTAPTAREIVARSEQGDPVAQATVDVAGRALGRAIAGLVTVLDPQLVLLTGGLAQAGPRWWQAVEAGLRTELVDHLAGVPLIPAALPMAAVVGAAEAARDLLDPGGPTKEEDAQ